MFEARIDTEAVKRMETVWEGRIRPPYSPDAKPGRVSKKLIKIAQPHVFRQAGALGGTVRAHLLSPKQRSDIARKGGKARWKKRRKSAVRC